MMPSSDISIAKKKVASLIFTARRLGENTAVPSFESRTNELFDRCEKQEQDLLAYIKELQDRIEELESQSHRYLKEQEE